jgi:hypothetical protein
MKEEVMKHSNFEECMKVKNYIQKLQKEVDITTIPRMKLLEKVRGELQIKIGIKALIQVLEYLGIKHERKFGIVAEQRKEAYSLLIDELSKLKTVVNDLIAVFNQTQKDMQEMKNHAFTSRQYVCDLADQLGVTFEQHNRLITNGKL